jgi:hypothetical protein
LSFQAHQYKEKVCETQQAEFRLAEHELWNHENQNFIKAKEELANMEVQLL